MQELITSLTEKAGISPDQATKVIDTIKAFVKDKFPMLSGAVDNMFASAPSAAGEASSAAGTGMMDKISDMIPGAAGQKVEDFAKDKLGGMFGGEKK